MSTLPMKSALATAALIAVSCFAGLPAAAQGIPTVGKLSGSAGPDADKVTLFWHTPVFDPTDARGDRECSYDIRINELYVDGSTWDSSVALNGEIPAVGIDPQSSCWVELYASAELSSDENVAYGDSAWLRAYVVCEVETDRIWRNRSLHYQKIDFYYKRRDVSENFKFLGTSYTTGATGAASWITGDMTDDTDGEWFTFKAVWGGLTFTVQGYVAKQVSQVDQLDYMLIESMWGTSVNFWGPWGGVHDYVLDDLSFQFDVQGGAVNEEVEVVVMAPEEVPPPVGMAPGVVGAMTAFEVVKADGPLLNLPVVVSVQYPEYMLAEYGGVAESTLRPYLYDEVLEEWGSVELAPAGIERELHVLNFTTERLGLFALAGESDGDGDGLGDLEELELGTEPSTADGDEDGVSDGDEIWFTNGDPNDGWKVDGEDQHGLGYDLDPTESYYVAARIVGSTSESIVSNCAFVPAFSELDGEDIPANMWPGALVATQDNATGMGDNLNELDQLYLREKRGKLSVGLTGNLADDGTGLALFFDTGPGGQNILVTGGFPIPPDAVPLIDGMVLDTGFEPDTLLFVNGWGGIIYANLYELIAGGGGTHRYVGEGTIGALGGFLTGGDNPNGMLVMLNNSNTEGVTDVDATGAETATSGFEMSVSLDDLGITDPEGEIKVMAMLVRNDGEVGNQFLPGLGGGYGNLGYMPIDLNDIPGEQFAPVSLSSVPGDWDGDSDVDLTDYSAFMPCLNGPRVGREVSCEGFDFDGDNYVTLGDFVSFQQLFTGDLAVGTFYPTDDAMIDMFSPDNNFGSSDKTGVRNIMGGSPSWEDDTLVMFDLSSIPPGTVISSATLYLYYFDYWDNNPQGRVLTCYRITSGWDESTVTWNNQPSHAGTVTSSAIVPTATGQWMSWDVTADVQAFIDALEDNYGWMIMDEEPWGGGGIPFSWFRTKEHGDFIPYLVVE